MELITRRRTLGATTDTVGSVAPPPSAVTTRLDPVEPLEAESGLDRRWSGLVGPLRFMTTLLRRLLVNF